MDSSGKKPEKFTILEQIYHEDKPENKPKNKNGVKAYFQDSKRIDKLLPGAILFFGLAAIVLGLFQFRHNLNKYFITPDKEPVSISQQQVDEDLLGLRQKDSDEDGLSDYDELYLYGTSPYIQDSDSDGYSDFNEIAKGTDPNCVEGQNCFGTWSSTQKEGVSPNDLFVTQKAQASQIRLLLQQSGAAPDDLAQFSDAELMTLYNEVLAEAQGSSSGGAKTVNFQADDITDLTPDEIRELLGDAGVSRNLLETISDQELMELVTETLTTIE